ncbi:MAG TPA: phytoene/squalene synthase family protein [Acidimicrobiia bacterium]|jgi:phytoene synthase
MNADRAAYARCRRINRVHGTTYYWATQLLPRAKRPHVHAVYAFCRYADDIVDDLGPRSTDARRGALDAFESRFFADLDAGCSDDLLLRAVVRTARLYGIGHDAFRRFLSSMRADLTVGRYDSWDDLCTYMDGSAAVIGEMMLPILEPMSTDAIPPARDLGLAFQLTNFLRDVGEDLGRDRVYLPRHDLERFGADPWLRRVTPAWRDVMSFEIARARRLYVSADRGIAMLPPRAARCIGAARSLYSRILDEIEAADYDVFSQRARVPTSVKLLTVASAWAAGAPPGAPAASRLTGARKP